MLKLPGMYLINLQFIIHSNTESIKLYNLIVRKYVRILSINFVTNNITLMIMN